MLFLCGEDESTALRAHTHSSKETGGAPRADRCASCTEEHGSRSPCTSSSCFGTSWTVVSAWEQRAWRARRQRWTLQCWTHRRWKLVAAVLEQKDRRPAVEAAVAGSGGHAFSSWRLRVAERPFRRPGRRFKLRLYRRRIESERTLSEGSAACARLTENWTRGCAR